MDNLEFSPKPESSETSESSVTSLSLKDATYEPESYVEQNQNHTQSERVESNVTTLVESIVKPEDGQAPVETKGVIREVDPDTGETKSTGDDDSGGSSGDQDKMAPPEGGLIDKQVARADQTVLNGRRDTSSVSNPGVLDMSAAQNPDAYQGTVLADVDQGTDIVKPGTPGSRTGTDRGEPGTPGTQTGGEPGSSTGDVDDGHLIPDSKLLDDKAAVIGMGTHGAVMAPDVKHASKEPGGSSSGGGDPVIGNRAGWFGETNSGTVKDGDEAKIQQKIHEKEGHECMTYVKHNKGFYKLVCEEKNENGTTKNTWIYTKGQSVDGVQPVPYTGSGTGHHEKTPHGPGQGPDVEANFLRMIAAKGGQAVNTTAYVGYGSSGSTSFSPSGGGEADDAGKFHGGLTASAGRPNNPDDPDYYTPNELKVALKTK